MINFLIFLIPLFFLPLTANFYDFNKNFLLCLGVCLLLLVWAIKVFVQKEIKIFRGLFDLPIFLFALVWVLATIFASPNKVEAFLLPGATGTIIALTLLYFLMVNMQHTTHKTQQVIVIGAGLLGLIAIYQFIGLGEIYGRIDWLKSKIWTPAGNPLTLITFLAAVFPLGLSLFLKKFPKFRFETLLWGLVTIIIALGGGIIAYQILPGKTNSLILLPYSSSWAIAVETFKQNPLLGVGPGNFVSAFNRFRPVIFNQHSFWNMRFLASSSYPLMVWSETGTVGLAVFLWLMISFIKCINILKNNSLYPSILLSFLLLFFLPGNFLLLFVFFVLLALITPKKEAFSFKIKEKIAWLPVAGVTLVLAPLVYFGGRAYAAEIYFKKSLDALAQNRGLDTYNNQIRAINLNPQREDFRLAYSQTNFALANSLATKKDLTDQDRANITQLIQQAIREAKVATVLNPTDSQNWENLAQIYRNLINFAQGADQWAVAAYQQAVVTDSTSPRLRLNLGGLFYAFGNYEEAIRQFRNCVDLKSDFANGWYNLAVTYREQKKYQEAYRAMEITLNLIPSDSPDWQKAKEELEELAKKLPAAEATPTPKVTPKPEEALTEPQPLPSPAIKPPLELPSEASPEASP